MICLICFFFFFQAEDGIRDADVTGVQTCALPISGRAIGPAVPGRADPAGPPRVRGRRAAHPLRPRAILWTTSERGSAGRHPGCPLLSEHWVCVSTGTGTRPGSCRLDPERHPFSACDIRETVELVFRYAEACQGHKLLGFGSINAAGGTKVQPTCRTYVAGFIPPDSIPSPPKHRSWRSRDTPRGRYEPCDVR